MSVKINWIEIDASILKLNPKKQLAAFTALINNNKDENPWSSLIKPGSIKADYYIISLLNNVEYKFTNEIIELFKIGCVDILSKYSPIEISEMTDNEVSIGNPGELFEVDERFLRILVPKEYLEYAKTIISNLFQKPQQVVEKCEWD